MTINHYMLGVVFINNTFFLSFFVLIRCW